jgi:hypothetical protein
VFVANLIGACAAAAIDVHLHLINQDLVATMLEVSGGLLGKAPLDVLLQGIPAGFLIASIASIRAGITSGAFFVVLTLTYTIALGNFTHVVAGSAEAFLLVRRTDEYGPRAGRDYFAGAGGKCDWRDGAVRAAGLCAGEGGIVRGLGGFLAVEVALRSGRRKRRRYIPAR